MEVHNSEGRRVIYICAIVSRKFSVMDLWLPRLDKWNIGEKKCNFLLFVFFIFFILLLAYFFNLSIRFSFLVLFIILSSIIIVINKIIYNNTYSLIFYLGTSSTFLCTLYFASILN